MPHTNASRRCVFSDEVTARIGVAGRRREMARAVEPLRVAVMISLAFNCRAISQVALPIASVTLLLPVLAT